MRIFRQKRQIILQMLFYSNGSLPAICFECSLHRWHPQKTKGASSPKGSVFGQVFWWSAVCTQPVSLFTRLNFWTPKTALKFHVRPEFNAILGFSEIHDSKFSGNRLLCREYSSPSGNAFTLEDLRTEAQSMKDFWDGSGANLPVLSKIGRTYGFLVGSSCFERIFTYYNKGSFLLIPPLI